MLAEIFMLRMEANLRNASALVFSSTPRFVPFDLSEPTPSQQIESVSRVINHPVRQSGDEWEPAQIKRVA